MPRLGETVTEGTVIKWLKNEGETVARDEMIVEIATDKVDTEIPSPFEGRLERILVTAGKDVAVGEVLAIIENAEGSRAEGVPSAPATKTEEPQPSRAEPKEEEPGFSPIVRKMAGEQGVDLEKISGTGHRGRVTKRDVREYVEARESEPAKKEIEETRKPERAKEAAAPGAREERVPQSNMRKIIAERMTRSIRTAAHVTAMIEVDMENIVRLREAHKEQIRERDGFSLTYMAFLSRAVVETLLERPTFNSTLDGETLIIKKYVNLGVAVSVPGGLIVPVIKEAQDLNILGLARAINNLARKARSGTLAPDDVREGTFTITDPGVFGTLAQTPIINPPEAAILSFDAVTKRPVVREDAIAIHHMVNLSLSYDHRINDGARAAMFLTDLKDKLEGAGFGDELLV